MTATPLAPVGEPSLRSGLEKLIAKWSEQGRMFTPASALVPDLQSLLETTSWSLGSKSEGAPVGGADLREALAELVALKDLNDKANQRETYDCTYYALIQEYERRKPSAWERAHAALGAIDAQA